ncbi:hypothetical protein G7Y79_00019g046660 [Physcia stellaris]|nr:hypothetical protein G7Y79_00019g046660 [Physcia stellaris]
MSPPQPTPRKRRRASDSDLPASSRTRRRAIEATTKREHSKRKTLDDHNAPIGNFSSKKRRTCSFQPADIQWTHGRKKPFHPKRSPYLYQWLPRRPPWYTSRVSKRPHFARGRFRRRRGGSKEQVQGMENWLAGYDPPFNAVCADGLSAALSELELDEGGGTASGVSPKPFVLAADGREVVEGEEEL